MLLQTVKMPDVQRDVLSSHRKLPLPLAVTAPALLRALRLGATAPLPLRAAHRFYPAPAPLRRDALLPPEVLSQPVLPRGIALRKTTGEALLQAGGAPHRNARPLLYTIY